jgi:hypothetical protein
MIKFIFNLLLCSFIFSACKSNNNVNSDPIDNVPVNITINLALPLYSHLSNPGTHVFEAGGVKGVVIVHHTDDNFYAFDRCCSYQPKNSCSKVEVDSTVLIFRCGESTSSGFTKCCDSRFFMNGDVINGPATFGLKQYQVFLNGNLLNVKN